MLVDCQLSDVSFSGSKYTWCSYHSSPTFIQERLDRILANQGWCSKFAVNRVSVLPSISSDHNPLFFYVSLQGNNFIKKRRLFRYEACWNLEECHAIFQGIWSNKGSHGEAMSQVLEKPGQSKEQLLN